MSVHSLVGTVNTQFYDNTGGAFFSPRDFYGQWKLFRRVADGADVGTIKPGMIPDDIHLDTREGAVRGMKWLIGSINDPFSKYLTREELAEELHRLGYVLRRWQSGGETLQPSQCVYEHARPGRY